MIPCNINEVWPLIKDAAASTMAAGEKEAEWLRQEVLDGRALCLSSPDGIVLAALVPNRLHDCFELVVLLAIAPDGNPHGAFERQEPAILDVARALGADLVKFHTRRRGWEKKLGPAWQLLETTFIRRVDDVGRKHSGPSTNQS